MTRRFISLFLIFSILIAGNGITFSDSVHWSTPLSDSLIEQGYLFGSDSIEISTQMTYDQFATLLNRFNLSDTIILQNNTNTITRLEAVKLIVEQMGYTYLANQLKDQSLPFTDVTTDKGYVRLALDIGMVSKNSNGLFRPDDLLLSEEGIALLYHLGRLQNLKMDSLMGYYAISSYSQIQFTSDLDDIAYGWSRLEYDDEADSIVLNTTSENGNEYRIPSGYSEPIAKAENADVSRFLMVTVEDDYIDSTPLTEAIISDLNYTNQTVIEISEMLYETADEFGFTGVLIDFESLKGSDNAIALTNFMSYLKIQLEDTGFQIAVAVHPVRKSGISYYDGYNFRRLGQIADKIILMAHDYYPKKLTAEEMASGITITPLTPIQDIYYAIRGITDPDTGVQDLSKVIFQLSMDSVQWKLKDGQIINERPYHPAYSSILSRIEQNITPQFSNELKSSFIIFQDTSDETRNVVWYEDARSVKAKMDLAISMGIKNFSVWRLGTIPDEEDGDVYLNVWQTISDYR